MRKLLCAAGILLLCATAVLWADHAEENRIMTEMAEAMNLFADRMESLSAPEDFIEAANDYSATIEAIGKEMVAIMKAHPEWGEDPPADVEKSIEAYMEAAGRYDPAMQTATKYANDHPDHDGCQKAMSRLAKAAYEMYQ